MWIYIKALLLIALLFLAITFGTQNSESVTLRYYFGLLSAPVPLYLVLYVAIILGILAGMAIGVSRRADLKKKVKKLEKANASLSDELEKMKAETPKTEEPETEAALAGPEIDKTEAFVSQTIEPGGEGETETEPEEPEEKEN
jgi:uncharacterized integral membrane protein